MNVPSYDIPGDPADRPHSHQPGHASTGNSPRPASSATLRPERSKRPDDALRPSTNMMADAVLMNGNREYGGRPDSDPAVGDLQDFALPAHQAQSAVMVQAHESIKRRVGSLLSALSLPEIQALQTQITLREKHLLTHVDHTELFAPLDPRDFDFATPETTDHHAGVASQEQISSPAEQQLSLLEYTQIREENSRLSEVVSTRATADLVATLRTPAVHPNIPGRRRGRVPVSAATSFVAAALRLTQSTVEKRLSAANTMWPDKQYRRSKVMMPRLAAQLEQGKMPLASAISAHDNLSDIRQAVRRAGGDEATADKLVEHTERELLQHATQNNAYTFARFAKSRKQAVTNELVGPQQVLTDSQIKYEKGVFYEAPIGDSLHRLTVVVDDAELLQLTAFREFATKLDSATSTLRAEAHNLQGAHHAVPTKAPLSAEDDRAGDDLPNNPRITPEDIDLGIAQLFDGQTKAERWLNTWLDFSSAGLLLHKTYDPNATPEEQQQRDTALHKAAEHSEVIADILGVDKQSYPTPKTTSDPPRAAKAPVDPLEPFIPEGYQLLRPNIDMIVEITLRDLVGRKGVPSSEESEGSSEQDAAEVRRIVESLQQQERGPTVPMASPGNIRFDLELARQQACHQRLIPMVLGSASQPLDVGRAQRSFPSAIRRALHVRDRGCIVPGCPRPSVWCQPHHILPWADGGDTSLANAALLCRHHHGAVHKQQILIHLEPEGRPSCSLPASLDPTHTRYRNVFWQA